MRLISYALAGLVAIASAGSGCATAPLNLGADVEPQGTSFKESYSRWTRDNTAVSWQELDTTLIVSATMRSRAFQHAFIDRYLKVYRINDPIERDRITKEELLLAESGLSFWVRSASHNPKWNELAPARGRWRISLIVDAEPPVPEISPEQVEQVNNRENVETSLFGQPTDVYRKTWHVRFPPLPLPATSGPRKLTLRFAGPEGKTDLVWQVE